MFRTHNFESIALLERDESELLDFGGIIQSCGNSLVVRLSGHKNIGFCCFYLVFVFADVTLINTGVVFFHDH